MLFHWHECLWQCIQVYYRAQRPFSKSFSSGYLLQSDGDVSYYYESWLSHEPITSLWQDDKFIISIFLHFLIVICSPCLRLSAPMDLTSQRPLPLTSWCSSSSAWACWHLLQRSWIVGRQRASKGRGSEEKRSLKLPSTWRRLLETTRYRLACSANLYDCRPLAKHING